MTYWISFIGVCLNVVENHDIKSIASWPDKFEWDIIFFYIKFSKDINTV